MIQLGGESMYFDFRGLQSASLRWRICECKQYSLKDSLTKVTHILNTRYTIMHYFRTLNKISLEFFQSKNSRVNHFDINDRKKLKNRQCMYKHNNGARSHNHCCRWKAITIQYYECVSVALVIQHAPYYIVMWPVWLYHIFAHNLIKYATFVITLLDIKYVFWFSLQLVCGAFLIVRIIQRDIIIHVKTSLCKVPVILVGL